MKLALFLKKLIATDGENVFLWLEVKKKKKQKQNLKVLKHSGVNNLVRRIRFSPSEKEGIRQFEVVSNGGWNSKVKVPEK